MLKRKLVKEGTAKNGHGKMLQGQLRANWYLRILIFPVW